LAVVMGMWYRWRFAVPSTVGSIHSFRASTACS
jgi:hypothetical protein